MGFFRAQAIKKKRQRFRGGPFGERQRRRTASREIFLIAEHRKKRVKKI